RNRGRRRHRHGGHVPLGVLGGGHVRRRRARRGAGDGGAPVARAGDRNRASVAGGTGGGAGGRSPQRGSPPWAELARSAAAGLFAAHDIVVGGWLAEEATLEHPVDLLLELGWLIALHAGELGKEAALALLRLEVAQEFGARALLVLGEPFDGAV